MNRRILPGEHKQSEWKSATSCLNDKIQLENHIHLNNDIGYNTDLWF